MKVPHVPQLTRRSVRRLLGAGFVVGAIVLLKPLTGVVQAATILTVTTSSNENDGCLVNSCSLREAIDAANLTLDDDEVIEFNISGDGPHVIEFSSTSFPEGEITEPVVIDGTSQPGYSGTPLIIVQKRSDVTANTNGFLIQSGGAGSTLRGIEVRDFLSAGIRLVGGNNTIEDMVIINNGGGTLTITNRGGIVIQSASTGNIIGGTGGLGNRIEDNTAYGLSLLGGTNTLVGNTITSNDECGIYVSSSNNDIGGSGGGEAMNTVTDNGLSDQDGICVVAGTGNQIFPNLIYGNTGLGIDLNPSGVTANDADDTDTGPNNGQNFPAIDTVSGTGEVTGSLDTVASTDFQLDFYYSTTCDPSGYGEGESYLGAFAVTTDTDGLATFSHTFGGGIPNGAYVTATATDPSGNTSEFSACVQLVIPGVTLSKTSAAGTEGGAIDSYTVALDTEPSANVTITADPDGQIDLGAGAGTAITLIFSPSGEQAWNIPQTVTITAVDDTDYEQDHTGSISHSASGGGYDSVMIEDVDVDITDNDPLPLPVAPINPDSLDVILDRFPPKVRIEGWLPNACSTLTIIQSRTGDDITIQVIFVEATERVCTPKTKPFKKTVELDGLFPPGTYTVDINGEVLVFTLTEELPEGTVGDPPIPPIAP